MPNIFLSFEVKHHGLYCFVVPSRNDGVGNTIAENNKQAKHPRNKTGL